MLASIQEKTACLRLLNFLLGLFLLHLKWGIALELVPPANIHILEPNSNFSVVCSGWSQISWQLPQDSEVEGAVVENQGSSSVLQFFNATWKTSGRYICEEELSDQRKEIDIFIPGKGPDEWFVSHGPGVVMKETEEDTIPCVVSDPKLNVTLYERPGRRLVTGMKYEPARGFTGPLNDTSYLCVAAMGLEETESHVYYVYSIVVPKVMEVEMAVSSNVLRQGEPLLVNCTVKDTRMVYFNWEFPRKEVIETLTDILPTQIRSFLNISMATTADSGVYVCSVEETMQGESVTKNVTITVLDQGYIYLRPSGDTNISALLHQTVDLSVEIDAHPTPTVIWMKDNQTVIKTNPVSTTQVTGSRYVSTLTLVKVMTHQTGTYSATVFNNDDTRNIIFYLEIIAPPRIMSLSEVGNKAMLCVSEGTPPLSITWYSCHGLNRCSNSTDGWSSLSEGSKGVSLQETAIEIEEKGVTQMQSQLTLQSLPSLSAVRCEAKNSAGRRARDLRIVTSSLLSQVVVLSAVLVLVVLVIIFLIILILLWRKKPHYEVRWKVIESVSNDGQQYTYLDPTQLPYNSTWEVPRENVVLGQVLGSGAFGRVVEATVTGLTHPDSTTKVAVKMVKHSSGAVQSLMSELKVLVHLGCHLNIVNLLGACTRGGPVYLITEYCRHGDLVAYLQRNKHTFLQSDENPSRDTDGGYMDMNKQESGQYVAMQELSYADIEPAVYETPYTPSDPKVTAAPLLSDSNHLTPDDLLSFSYQVSQAMDFLSSRNCVHRDLAARNVLVCEGKLVKVCDFGLARDLRKNEDYIARGNTFLPVKWMSPESIFQNIYSSQSDVWSYGVFLWEVFSLGGSPYSDLPMIQEFYCALKQGYRMNQPEHAPGNIYDLIKQCWDEDPYSRPSFSSLVSTLSNMITEDYKEKYLRLTEDFQKGQNPAVAQSQLNQSTVAEEQTEGHSNTNGNHIPEVKIHLAQVESEEAGPSQGTYIIPVTDITITHGSGSVLDAVSPQQSDTTSQDLSDAQEITSLNEGQKSSCSREEEESCL